MTIAIVVIICLTVLAFTVLVQHPWRDYEDESVHDLVKEKSTVVVNLLTGDAIRGVVLRSTKTYVELGEGRYMGSGAQVNMTGRTRIPRTNVLFVQDVTAEPEPLANTDR